MYKYEISPEKFEGANSIDSVLNNAVKTVFENIVINNIDAVIIAINPKWMKKMQKELEELTRIHLGADSSEIETYQGIKVKQLSEVAGAIICTCEV